MPIATRRPSLTGAGHEPKSIVIASFILLSAILSVTQVLSQAPQVGDPGRPSYETFRMDKIVAMREVSYWGNLDPVIAVSGDHALLFPGRGAKGVMQM